MAFAEIAGNFFEGFGQIILQILLFQIQIIRISAGSYDTNIEKDINYYVHNPSSITIFPGETSPTLTVNVMGRMGLDNGIQNIKIPLQPVGKMGNRIGETNYYLLGQIDYRTRYCSDTVKTDCVIPNSYRDVRS
ncbi:MAG: hypothetical protein ACOC32_02895 [Nanoarchaeota archaeon]